MAKRVHAISEQLPRKLSTGLTRMGRLSLEQLKNVLDAYASMSDAKALEVWRGDEEVDALYNSIFRELLTYMMEDPRMIGLCTHLLFGAKNFERIGDHLAVSRLEDMLRQEHVGEEDDVRQREDRKELRRHVLRAQRRMLNADANPNANAKC